MNSWQHRLPRETGGYVSGDRTAGVGAAATVEQTYAVHNLVTLLHERVPPRTRPIDIADGNWLRGVWEDVFQQMEVLRAEHHEFAELMDHVCAVVINYDSVSAPGNYGGRHTAVMLNGDRFCGVPKRRVQGIGALTGQNHVFVYHDDQNSRPRRTKRRPEGVARAFWLENWLRYILLDNGPDQRPERDPTTFTLNNMLLRRAAYPRSVLISWNEQMAADRTLHRDLAPMTVDVSGLRRGTSQVPNPLEPFVAEFRQMFKHEDGDRFRDRNGRDWRINGRTMEDMLTALLRHFGAVGGDAFYTIPVMLRVNPVRGRAAEPDTELRAAVSVLLKVPPKPEVMRAGWFFFDGVANRIVRDILLSEFTAHSHQRWEGVRADSIHLASHPIKHKSRPALSAQRALLAKIDRLTDLWPKEDTPQAVEAKTLLAESRGLCVRATTNIQIVDGIANLMSLLLELGPELRSAIERDLASEHSKHAMVDLFGFLATASTEVVDKIVGSHSVSLVYTGEPKILVPRRFRSEALRKHRELEPIFHKAILSELLQNAANNGINPHDFESKVIPVYVDAGYPFRLSNFVDPEGAVEAEARARQISSEEPLERLSSGMYFVKKVFADLGYGRVYARCYRNEGRIPDTPPDLYVWEYILDLNGR